MRNIRPEAMLPERDRRRMRAAAFASIVPLFVLLGGCGGSGSDSRDDDQPPPQQPPQPVTGLDSRAANLTCVAPSRAGTSDSIELVTAFASLPAFGSPPLTLLQAPGDDSRWYAAERSGNVRSFANTPDVAAFDSVDFVSIDVNASGEGGLLGMAFDPDYASNGRVYLSWTEGSPLQSVVGRFTSLDGGQTLDPAYEEIIRVNQDFSNHNGGNIAFGDDGYLYFGLGDGGSSDDPNGRAQNTTNLLGAMLRLDVSGAGPGYAIPPDNPFAGNPQCPANHTSATNCPEIYAWGLRNPWRWNFDAATGELWLGDVGQDTREEVDIVEIGGNYGWDCREGSIANATGASASCPAGGLIDPVHDYDRSQGDVSITGGYVYRGSAIPALVGTYLFGDFASGRIWRLNGDAGSGYTAQELLDHSGSILSFAQGNDGELYVLDGGIRRIVAAAAEPPGDDDVSVPAQLSATGCFAAANPASPAGGLLPYAPIVGDWADGAQAERWLAIPDGTVISVGADGDFAFPNGSVLAQHLRLAGALVETRLLMRHPDGEWAGYSYEWNAAGTDASLVTGGKVATKGGQEWIFPSGGQCLGCHNSAAGFGLGAEVAQLNSEFTYAATGRTHNQLATLDAIGMFAAPLGDPASLGALAGAGEADLDARARSYLHANCAHCHRPGGPTPVDLDLRATTLIENTNACNVAPAAGDAGIADPLIIAPGEPARSVLLERTARRDALGMPPVASNLIDTDGVGLLESWIAGLDPSCR